MNKRRMLLAACLVAASSWASAQVRVTGTVVSAEDGQPVVGASVIVPGTKVGVVTDLNGHFILTVPKGHSKVRVSSIGMTPLEVAAQENLHVALQGNASALNEVVVTAYGTTTKAAFTGSAGIMDAQQIEQRQVSNVTNALAGAVAGVQIQNDNGQPGVGAKVKIRGIGSINASTSPLYVVDGVPFDGDISSINTDDIESLTVLKDASSMAMYGARGANGIIMITTKKGKSGKATVNFTAKWGSNSRAIKNYDVLTSPAEYVERVYQSLYNYASLTGGFDATKANQWANKNLDPWQPDANGNLGGVLGYPVFTLPEGESLIGADGKLNPKATLGAKYGDYYYTPDDWSKETFHNKLRQEYNANISGSTERMNYYASFGYLDDQGVIDNSGFKRYTGRLKADYQATDWLKIGANMAYTNSNSTYPRDQDSENTTSSGNAFYLANNIASIYPMYVRGANGNILYNKAYNKPIYDYGDGNPAIFNRPFMGQANPAGQFQYDTREYLMDILSLNWFAELTPVKGLTLTARWGLNVDNTRLNTVLNPLYGQFASMGGQATQYALRNSGFDQQYIANYQHSFNGEHNIDVTVGYDGYSFEATSVSALGSYLYNPNDIYVDNTINQKNGGGDKQEYATVGYFGRINYNYKNTYFASFSYRRDGSSRFTKDNRWGNFFSGSAAWVISNESFMKDLTWVNLLKLKASVGQQGNDALLYSDGVTQNYFPAWDQYKVTGANSVFSDATLYYKGNSNLTWEKSTSYNVGIDFSLFDSRLNGSIEYFGRQSNDMLYNKPTAPILGYSSIPMNVGSMRNTGVEIDLNYDIFKTKDFSWNVNLNASFIKNKILKLHPDLNGKLISGTRILEEGESMYRFYLVKYAGVDPENGDALYWAKDDKGEEYKTHDWSIANETDRVATKDILPTVYGGFGTTVNAYGFDFSIQLSYQLGGKIYDSGYQDLMHGGDSSNMGRNWSTDIRKAWTPENKNTDVPRLDYGDNKTYQNMTSDRWLTSSNYLSINNITFGYTLPANLTKKALINKLRLFFTADNVALFTTRKGLDPRQSYTTSTTSLYSPIRTISGGINITF